MVLGQSAYPRGTTVLRLRRVSGSLALLSVAAAVSGCAGAPPEVPAELWGSWTAQDERFAGRAMELGVHHVAFETGAGLAARHPVVAVEEATSEAAPRRVIVVYEGEGGREYRLALVYDAGSGDLRLANRAEVVWTRDEGS